MRLTGKPDKACRGLLGQWLKASHDDAALVGLVLAEAEAQRPADPMAWITAALQSRTGQRLPVGKPNNIDSWLRPAGGEQRPSFDFDSTAEEQFR